MCLCHRVRPAWHAILVSHRHSRNLHTWAPMLPLQKLYQRSPLWEPAPLLGKAPLSLTSENPLCRSSGRCTPNVPCSLRDTRRHGIQPAEESERRGRGGRAGRRSPCWPRPGAGRLPAPSAPAAFLARAARLPGGGGPRKGCICTKRGSQPVGLRGGGGKGDEAGGGGEPLPRGCKEPPRASRQIPGCPSPPASTASLLGRFVPGSRARKGLLSSGPVPQAGPTRPWGDWEDPP